MSIIKNDKRCSQCICGIYLKGDCLLTSGVICKLNPLNPVPMGLNGKHSDRKEHIQRNK